MTLNDLLQNQVLVGLSGATVLGGLLYVGRRFPGLVWRTFLDQFSVSFETVSTDATFFWIVNWLASNAYTKRARNLTLSADHDRNNENEERNVFRYLLSPGRGVHFLMVGNRPALLTRSREEEKAGALGNPARTETLSLRVLGRERSVADTVILEAVNMLHKETKKSVSVSLHKDDYWYVGLRQPIRDLSSVILAEGIMEVLLDDITTFRSQSAWYAERGIPWRRGYELFGPPGCGKSSLVSALASHFGCGVSMLNLSSVSNDGDLVYLLRCQPQNSILLVEDVDAGFKDRTAKDAKITFSSFLNAIDGLAAPDGRILFMTTNHPELLDPAMTRPGRIDLPIEIGLATANQAARMYVRFFGKDHADKALAFGRSAAGMTPASIQKLMMEHRESADAAARVIAHRLQVVA